MHAFGWKKTLIFSLLPLCLLAAGLEGGARLLEFIRPPLAADYGWGFEPGSRVFVPAKDAPGQMITEPAKEISFVKQQFQMPKPEKCFRIFVVGGSSVNYARWQFEDLRTSLAAQFFGKHVFEIIDVGGCAYGSHRLAVVVAELLNYQPDLIVYYEANNEFEEVEQLKLARPATVRLQRLLYSSAFCRFLRDRVASEWISRLRRERERRAILATAPNLPARQSASSHDYSMDEIDDRMQAFRNNLSSIITACRARGVPLLLGTVPSNLWKPRLDQDPEEAARITAMFEQGRYEEGLAHVREVLRKSTRHQASDTENGIIRDLAKEHGLPLADMESRVVAAEPHRIPGETLFQDHCHLNQEGRELLMRVFEEQIVPIVRGLDAARHGK